MAINHDPVQLARILPGIWRIGASNFPVWLSGERTEPTFNYELKNSDPLELHDVVSWGTSKGAERTTIGVDKWSGDGFIWRGTKLRSPLTSHWSVLGTAHNDCVLAIRFSKALFSAAGVDNIIRDGVDPGELRAIVAHSSESLGLTPGEFASLTWIDLS